MNRNQIISLVVCAVGLFGIGYAMNAKSRIAAAKGDIDAVSGPFSQNPVGKFVGQSLYGRASQYDVTVNILLIGGIVFAVAGGWAFYHYRRK